MPASNRVVTVHQPLKKCCRQAAEFAAFYMLTFIGPTGGHAPPLVEDAIKYAHEKIKEAAKEKETGDACITCGKP